MKVLVCGPGGSELVTGLRARLGSSHDVTVAPEIDEPTLEVASQSDAIFFVLTEPGPGQGDDLLQRTTASIYRLLSKAKRDARFVLFSSLRIFDTCPVDWLITEDWRPRPTGRIEDILVHLAEAMVREASRTLPIRGVILRHGDIVRDGGNATAWGVHIDDLLDAAELSLTFRPPEGYMWGWPQPEHGLWVFHVVGGGENQRFALGHETANVLGYRPKRDVSGATAPSERRIAAQPRELRSGPIRKVAVFGAWGPMGAAVAERLQNDVQMRLCDIRTMEGALEKAPAVRGDPRPRRLEGGHEERIIDITDADQVAAAAEGMDALINLSVSRSGLDAAFAVNTVGSYNIVNAALRHGIGRVVLTGPEQVSDRQQGGYWPDFQLPPYSSPRPGMRLYFLSKLLGLEAARLVAEENEMEVAALVFGHLRDPEDVDVHTIEGMPIAVSWKDGADAIACALTAPKLRPFQVFSIVADLPHDKLSNADAKDVLGWRPRDSLDVLWSREARRGTTKSGS